MFKRNHVLKLLLICLLLLGIMGIAVAQDGGVVEPLNLSSELLVIDFSTSAAAPPMVDPLTDGRMTFRIDVQGEVSGGVDGVITGRVSEVTLNPPSEYHPATVMFTIETEFGMMEGYYQGGFYRPEDSDQATISASGHILSVSGAYADLYLADVVVDSFVQFEDGRSVGESGTMTLSPR